jgi:hypothetical protein
MGAGVAQPSITPAGAESLERFGSSTEASTLSSSTTSAEALGASTVLAVLTIQPAGIASSEAIGAGFIKPAITSAGIESLERLGAQIVVSTVSSPIASGELFGASTTLANVSIQPASIATLESFGAATALPSLSASAILTLESVGSMAVLANLTPSGVSTFELFGTPFIGANITFFIYPLSITSAENFGAVTLTFLSDGKIIGHTIALTGLIGNSNT